MISNQNGLSARLKIALNQLDVLRGEIQAITQDAEQQSDLRSELGRLAVQYGVMEVPVSGSTAPKAVSKAAKYLEAVTTPDLLEPGMGETLPQFIGRVMKSHGHASSADIENYTDGKIESRLAKGALTGVVPNKRTHESWSLYLGISRNVLDALISTTKAQHGN